MRVPKINFNNSINFSAIVKAPTQDGYRVYDNNVLSKDVSFDIRSKTLTEDTFDKSGQKTRRKISVFPMGQISDVEYEYDKSHKLLKNTIKDGDGEIVLEDNFTYRDDGKLKSSKQHDYVADMSALTRYSVTGRKLNTSVRLGDETEFTRYVYDDNGMLRQEITYDKDNRKVNTVEYEYGWYRTPIKCSQYDKDSKLVYEELYNERTGKVLKTTYNRHNAKSETEYFYNATDDKLMFKTTSENGVETSFTRYRYDEKGKLQAVVTLKDGELSSLTEFEPTGKVKSEIKYKKGGNDYDAKFYEYDQYGRGVSCLAGSKSSQIANMYLFDYDTEQFVEFKP